MSNNLSNFALLKEIKAFCQISLCPLSGAKLPSVTPGSVRNWTGTLCFLFQTFKVQSRLTISKYRIQNTKYNYHRGGVHQNLYTYTESHLLIQTLIHIHV